MTRSPQTAPNRLVVGCGALGGRVARRWRARGDGVIGVIRSPARFAALAEAGVVPAMIDVTDPGDDWAGLFAELGPPATLFWGVGFSRDAGGTSHDLHVTGLGRLLDALAAAAPAAPVRIIFSSSTGVWGDEGGGTVTEATPVQPDREAGRVLVEAEALLASHPLGPGTALRFAGLYGPGRLPRLDALRAGRPVAADPETWLNLVHLDDAARIVEAVADLPEPAPLYVVSDGRPVRRREWYERLAAVSSSPPPVWDPAAAAARGGDKRVDPSRLFADLRRADPGFHLAHPDALATLADLVAQAAPATD